ncbi:unnamed protein product [Ilex paraguariensis]|uniref:Uncharacterized protein n=1 Tax=Ilex paraguariensis TaxID=185542 RepID=A0ABC8TTV2_9AQUA
MKLFGQHMISHYAAYVFHYEDTTIPLLSLFDQEIPGDEAPEDAIAASPEIRKEDESPPKLTRLRNHATKKRKAVEINESDHGK